MIKKIQQKYYIYDAVWLFRLLVLLCCLFGCNFVCVCLCLFCFRSNNFLYFFFLLFSIFVYFLFILLFQCKHGTAPTIKNITSKLLA